MRRQMNNRVRQRADQQADTQTLPIQTWIDRARERTHKHERALVHQIWQFYETTVTKMV